MDSFRQANRWRLLLWGLFLSLALLCAQGAKLHTHNFDHGCNDYHSCSHSIDKTEAHAHFTYDTSHKEHHDGALSKIDISPDQLFKNTHYKKLFAIALFALFFALMAFISSRQPVQRCQKSKLTLKDYYLLSPPLRAPPQH